MEDNISIKINRTNRLKTISIQVIEDKVRVSVPKNLEQAKIDKYLKSKSKWIKKKLLIQSKIAPLKQKEYVSGEDFLYRGKHYRLKLVTGTKYNIKLTSHYLKLTVKDKSNKNKIKRLIKKWYLQRANEYLNQETIHLSKKINLEFIFVKVRNYKSRWGSCSSDGKIFYNWKIILAPKKIIKYVIFHELTHLKYHNHSPKFWRLLRSYYPEINEAKEWLSLNGNTLII